VAQVLDALARPVGLQRRCRLPLDFEWSVAEATAGTFMDYLVHTWDLATATGEAVPSDASAQHRLPGAMGRQP
jgi:hypothetical protein